MGALRDCSIVVSTAGSTLDSMGIIVARVRITVKVNVSGHDIHSFGMVVAIVVHGVIVVNLFRAVHYLHDVVAMLIDAMVVIIGRGLHNYGMMIVLIMVVIIRSDLHNFGMVFLIGRNLHNFRMAIVMITRCRHRMVVIIGHGIVVVTSLHNIHNLVMVIVSGCINVVDYLWGVDVFDMVVDLDHLFGSNVHDLGNYLPVSMVAVHNIAVTATTFIAAITVLTVVMHHDDMRIVNMHFVMVTVTDEINVGLGWCQACKVPCCGVCLSDHWL
jgi:hypothetical protein